MASGGLVPSSEGIGADAKGALMSAGMRTVAPVVLGQRSKIQSLKVVKYESASSLQTMRLFVAVSRQKCEAQTLEARFGKQACSGEHSRVIHTRMSACISSTGTNNWQATFTRTSPTVRCQVGRGKALFTVP